MTRPPRCAAWVLNSYLRRFMLVKDEELPLIRGIMEDPEGFDYSACHHVRRCGF